MELSLSTIVLAFACTLGVAILAFAIQRAPRRWSEFSYSGNRCSDCGKWTWDSPYQRCAACNRRVRESVPLTTQNIRLYAKQHPGRAFMLAWAGVNFVVAGALFLRYYLVYGW